MFEYSYEKATKWAKEASMRDAQLDIDRRRRARAKWYRYEVRAKLENPVAFLQWLGTGLRVQSYGEYEVKEVKECSTKKPTKT